MAEEKDAKFRVTIVHLGGTRKQYEATVTQTQVLVYPPMDTPHAFGIESGKSRTLRQWRLDADSQRKAAAYSAIKYRTKGRARYVTSQRRDHV